MTKAEDITVPWLEWHNTREQLKEARRLMRRALDMHSKGENLDRGQIEGWLNRQDDIVESN